MSKLDQVPLPTDTKFFDSPDAGDPTCVCSRCGQKIEEWESPCLRAWPPGENAEYRYHWRCVGGKDKTKQEWEDEQDDFYALLYP
jgi:hypothetical protein